MAQVYIETSFVSACVTTRTDAGSTFRRDVSREWWRTQRQVHELFASLEVINELSSPAYPTSREALDWIRDVPLLDVDEDVRGLAEILVRERVMPSPAVGDAIHVAVCCVSDVDYLLSWNVRHLANPSKLVHLRTICLRAGFLPPVIVTPDQLWENKNE